MLSGTNVSVFLQVMRKEGRVKRPWCSVNAEGRIDLAGGRQQRIIGEGLEVRGEGVAGGCEVVFGPVLVVG